MAKIAPSILSADFVNLERDIRSLSTHGPGSAVNPESFHG